jgi:hypothetical protein
MNSSAFDDDDDVDDDAFLEAENFSDYVPSTYQPGWSWTYYTIFICILINCTLPILLLRAKRRDEAEKREREAAKNPAGIPENPKEGFFDGEEAASVVSAARSLASSAVISQVASSLLDQKVNKGVFHRHQTRKRRARRVFKSEHPAGNDDAASESQSVLGKLEEDAISVRDAVDADLPTKESISGEKLTMGERIVDSSTWDKEMRKLVSLWVPYSISGAADGLSQILNFAIISHYIGPKEANAYVTVVILTEFTEVFTYGFAEGKNRNLSVCIYIRKDDTNCLFLAIFLSFYSGWSLGTPSGWSWQRCARWTIHATGFHLLHTCYDSRSPLVELVYGKCRPVVWI